MNKKRIIICDRDFSTMLRAQSSIAAPNIELSMTIEGHVCEICRRFYGPLKGYLSVENGKTVCAEKPCSNKRCGTSQLHMALTANQNGEKAWQCPRCSFFAKVSMT